MLKGERKAQLQEALEKLYELEEEYDVSIEARGGSYGGARLIVRDKKSDMEISRN